jgi:hypothetical protein
MLLAAGPHHDAIPSLVVHADHTSMGGAETSTSFVSDLTLGPDAGMVEKSMGADIRHDAGVAKS